MVDAKQLRLVEMAAQLTLQLACAVEVVAEGFFDHHAAPAIGGAQQLPGGQPGHHAGILRRRQRHVEHDIAARRVGEFLAQARIGFLVVQLAAKIADACQKTRQRGGRGAERLLRRQAVTYQLDPFGCGVIAPTAAQDAGCGAEASAALELKQRGQQLCQRQVAGRAEDDAAAVFNHRSVAPVGRCSGGCGIAARGLPRNRPIPARRVAELLAATITPRRAGCAMMVAAGRDRRDSGGGRHYWGMDCCWSMIRRCRIHPLAMNGEKRTT